MNIHIDLKKFNILALTIKRSGVLKEYSPSKIAEKLRYLHYIFLIFQ